MNFRLFLDDLQRNIAAGVRLAFLRPVRQVEFRIGPAQFVALAVLGAFCASLVDLAVIQGAAQWHPAALGDHVRDAALLLLITWAVATWLRAPGLAIALPVVLLAAGWLPDLVFASILALPGWFGVSRASHFMGLWWTLLGWSLVIAWRALDTVLQGRGRHALPVRLVSIAAVFGGTFALAMLFPSPHLWQERPDADAAAAAAGEQVPRVESEEAMAAQPRLLFDALSSLEEREPGGTNYYFVGFAGDASQDVFRNDMEAAQEVVDAQLGTDGRSVILVNSPRTVLDLPLATMTNLRAALGTVGRLIDPDEDVAVLYLSSHGSADHRLYVNFPPLALQQITPTALQRALQEAGIKWKVVVVSACYSGGYIEPLKDPYSVVITSSRADRTSFGCENDAHYTFFGEAYFQHALKATPSLIEAFALARSAIAAREKAEGLTPSEPQMAVGEEIARKLGVRAKPTNIAAAALPPR